MAELEGQIRSLAWEHATSLGGAVFDARHGLDQVGQRGSPEATKWILYAADRLEEALVHGHSLNRGQGLLTISVRPQSA